MRLASKITLLFLVPYVGLLVLFGYRSAQREIAVYDGQIAADLKAIGRVARASFLELSRVEGEARAVELLATAGDDGLDARWIPQSKPGPPEVLLDEVGNIVTVTVPIDDPAVSGSIVLSRPLDEAALVRAAAHDQILATAIALGIAVLLSAIVGIGFIGRPVRALALQARRVARGDLSQRVALLGRDELGDLAREIDVMCDDLAAARDRAAAEGEGKVKALEQLRHADRLATVGKLASGVAHELGTPLTVVAGRARNLVSRPVEREEIVESATVIVEQAERMTRIIRQLLEFSRRRIVEKHPVAPNDLLSRVVRVLQPLALKHGALLDVRATECATIDADPTLLEQVLMNLVVNAIDAMPKGGTVELGVRNEGSTVVIEVRDHGTGIPAGDLEHVFEPFFTTKEVGKGTGLGLSVAHGIVRDHGGTISVASEVGTGTTFTLSFPRSAKEKDPRSSR